MCIFCKIVSGEIPCTKVYEDDLFLGFLDINGVTKGHTLIVPKKHFSNLLELDNEHASKVLIACKNVMTKLKDNQDIKGFNIINNNGEAAGQTVHHFHVHIIPRYNDDKVCILNQDK